MLHVWRVVAATAALVAAVEGSSAFGASRTAAKRGHDEGALTFVAVSPKDPFVDMTAAQFVEDYQTKLRFHFATIHANRVVTAEVAKHKVDDEFNWDGDQVVLDTDVLMTTGYTYRVNLFLAQHFDSAHFGGPKYHTVASADYTCKNDTASGERCKPESFLENPRRVQSIETIPQLVKDTLNSTVLFQKMAIHFTAYETQALTTHTPDAVMHYVAFAIHDEPVQCRASLYYDGFRTHVLHYNTDCLTATYDSAMLDTAERDDKLKIVGILAAVAAVMTVVGVFVARRATRPSANASGQRYSPVRLQKAPAEASPKADIRDPSKSYSSMAV